MDFEMQYHVIQELDCITRGGMCMPFHTNQNVHRLSVDIDLLTSKTVEQTRQVMQKINRKLTEVSIKEIEASNPYPIPNIVSYNVKYDSCYNHDDYVKVDFLCDVDLPLPYKIINTNFHIFNFSIDYEMNLLTHGSLIADKFTTLALNKIGLPTRKFGDIPKQIYDIATLLKIGNDSIFGEAITIFRNFTKFKVEHYEHSPPFNVKDTIQSINDSILDLLDTRSTLTLTTEEESRFASFKGTYLSTTRNYKKTEHITNILLTKLFSKFLKETNDGNLTEDQAAKRISNVVKQFNDIMNYNASQRAENHEVLFRMVSDNVPFNKNILKGAPIEHVLLVKEIWT